MNSYYRIVYDFVLFCFSGVFSVDILYPTMYDIIVFPSFGVQYCVSLMQVNDKLCHSDDVHLSIYL